MYDKKKYCLLLSNKKATRIIIKDESRADRGVLSGLYFAFHDFNEDSNQEIDLAGQIIASDNDVFVCRIYELVTWEEDLYSFEPTEIILIRKSLFCVNKEELGTLSYTSDVKTVVFANAEEFYEAVRGDYYFGIVGGECIEVCDRDEIDMLFC